MAFKWINSSKNRANVSRWYIQCLRDLRVDSVDPGYSFLVQRLMQILGNWQSSLNSCGLLDPL